ncbi:hypothetical protein [Clostridium butyricum]|nr:hypothetical protein [Clostridium butyricum]
MSYVDWVYLCSRAVTVWKSRASKDKSENKKIYFICKDGVY